MVQDGQGLIQKIFTWVVKVSMRKVLNEQWSISSEADVQIIERVLLTATNCISDRWKKQLLVSHMVCAVQSFLPDITNLVSKATGALRCMRWGRHFRYSNGQKSAVGVFLQYLWTLCCLGTVKGSMWPWGSPWLDIWWSWYFAAGRFGQGMVGYYYDSVGHAYLCRRLNTLMTYGERLTETRGKHFKHYRINYLRNSCIRNNGKYDVLMGPFPSCAICYMNNGTYFAAENALNFERVRNVGRTWCEFLPYSFSRWTRGLSVYPSSSHPSIPNKVLTKSWFVTTVIPIILTFTD